MTLRNEMKELLKNLNAAEEISNKLDKLWEADPENEELENQWDTAYKAEYEAMEAAVQNLMTITSGKIDHETARIMLLTKRTEIERLFA